jgi:hypothetical protein
MRRRFGLVLFALGGGLLALAVGWWWFTYANVVTYSYLSLPEAGVCLVGDSEICRLARSLCRGAHPLTRADYPAPLFWAGVMLLSASLLGRVGRAG